MSTVLDLSDVAPGFADPTRDSQAVFRKLMEAVARPGRVQDLGDAPDAPHGLDRAAGAAALTLFDFETEVWLDPVLRGGPAEAWIRFHCGCPLTTDPGRAAFAVVADPATAPALAAFNQGDAKYPDRSTTVILQIPSLSGGAQVVLTGPGIQTSERVAPQGLPPDFWDQVETNHGQFQFGVDLLLCAGDLLLGLPRSTRINTNGG